MLVCFLWNHPSFNSQLLCLQILRALQKLLTYGVFSVTSMLSISRITFIYKVKTFDGSNSLILVYSHRCSSHEHRLSAITTLERSSRLCSSHSPISIWCYLSTSFSPHVETLEVLQIWVVFSAVIPLRLPYQNWIYRNWQTFWQSFGLCSTSINYCRRMLSPTRKLFLSLWFWVFYFIVNEKKWGNPSIDYFTTTVKEGFYLCY